MNQQQQQLNRLQITTTAIQIQLPIDTPHQSTSQQSSDNIRNNEYVY